MTLSELHTCMARFRSRNRQLYLPWRECSLCPNRICSESQRRRAAVLAALMLWDCPEVPRTREDLSRSLHLLIPSLQRMGVTTPGLCYCTAVQFLRKASLEYHIYCCGSQSLAMLKTLPAQFRKEDAND